MPSPSNAKFRRCGFTLLELSIVVMVIGLIVGGVLAGEELLRGSELQRTIKERDKIFSAVSSFRLKFHAIPGDFDAATNFWGTNSNGCPNGNSTTGTCNGNSNSVIEWGGWATQSEGYRFWQHLGLSGMYPGLYTGAVVATTYISIGTNVPAVANTGGFWSAQSVAPGTAANFNLYGNAIAAFGPTAGSALYTPEDAKRIDKKADDGLAGSGRISATNMTDCTVTSGVVVDYKVDALDPTCALYFWLDYN